MTARIGDLFACLLIVIEPMSDAEIEHLGKTGDTSGLEFVSINIHSDARNAAGIDAIDLNVIGRRSFAVELLDELGVSAFGFDEYGWKEIAESPLVTISIPGRLVYTLEDETSFPSDSPSAWKSIKEGRRVVRGAGRSFRAEMTKSDADDLRGYLESVVDVVESMTREERGGQSLAAERAVIARIDAALGDREEV